MSATLQDLRMVADLLLKDNAYMSDFCSRNSPLNRRRVIHDFGKQNGYDNIVNKIADRESIRLYIEDVEGLDSPASDKVASFAIYQMRAAGSQNLTTTVKITPTSKDNTMNAITKTQAIEVTTQVNVNGVNAANYSDAQLYGMIQQQEYEIKALNALQNKPQSLLAEIAKRQAGIDALVGYLNDRDAAKNPAPATVGQATDQLAR